MTGLRVSKVESRQDLTAFCRFPRQIYRGDPNWVPPLLSDRLKYLDPRTGPLYTHAGVVLLQARRGRELAGTIAPFVDHTLVKQLGRMAGGFGFFEAVDDWRVARALLDAACGWLRARGAVSLEGPHSFTAHEAPGVLVEPSHHPQAMLEAYTPLYYKEALERYGLQPLEDLYSYRATRAAFGDNSCASTRGASRSRSRRHGRSGRSRTRTSCMRRPHRHRLYDRGKVEMGTRPAGREGSRPAAPGGPGSAGEMR